MSWKYDTGVLVQQIERIQDFKQEERKAFLRSLSKKMENPEFFAQEEAIATIAGGILIACQLKRENPHMIVTDIDNLLKEMSKEE